MSRARRRTEVPAVDYFLAGQDQAAYVAERRRGALAGQLARVPMKLNPVLTHHYRAISERRPVAEK